MAGEKNKLKRVIVDLTVDEVSLVDSPAIEKEFVIIKRLQEASNMSEDNIQTKKGAEGVQSADDVEKIDLKKESEKTGDQPTEAGDAVQKALDKVADIVEGVANVAKTRKGDESKDAKKSTKDEFRERLVNAGLDEKDVEKAMAGFESFESAEAKKEMPKDVQPDVLDVLQDAITKAKKFSNGGDEKLKHVVETLKTLVGEDEAQKPVEKVQKEDTVNAVKNLGKIITEALAEFSNTTKSMGERLEKIEKTRNPSKSVDGDGGTDKGVKKSQSMWEGIL